jgi:alkanesulfonate monooxygenase SsuD/methylene tetrahydromethanopterin reductase-like flavin-dependent oxidoreductase (luciferase family)
MVEGRRVEFGIFVQMPLYGAVAHDPAAEHEAMQLDIDMIVEADRHGFKYAWVSEHHALTEYSHLSASESFIPYTFPLTERIHVGSGIWPLNPAQNHPVRLAERVAMCDHLSKGRFEFGCGRGAGSHEIGTFGLQTSETKAIWDEVIWEFTKMWGSPFYSHDGTAFSTPERNILPKPYGGGSSHPPIWVAAGNTDTYAKAARHGIGVLGFNVGAIDQMGGPVAAYKAAVADATPVGRFVNDNVMITTAVICAESSQDARDIAFEAAQMSGYHLSLVFLYHDTFPRPDGAARWPEHIPPPTRDDIDAAIATGALICGTPSEVRDQLRGWEALGMDQLSFGMPFGKTREQAMSTIRLFGDEVIPAFDLDPVHRSTRMRNGEVPLTAKS